MAVKVARHEDTGTTLISRTLAPQPVDFTVLIDLVVFEYGQLDLLPLMLVLLGGGVGLLLPLLGTTTQPQHQVERRLLLDVVVGQCASILQLLPSEDQTLLVRRDTLFVLDLGLDIFDGI